MSFWCPLIDQKTTEFLRGRDEIKKVRYRTRARHYKPRQKSLQKLAKTSVVSLNKQGTCADTAEKTNGL